MKKPNKNTNPSMELTPVTTMPVSVKEFLDPESSLLFPGKTQWLKRLAFTLIKESRNTDMLFINTFCKKYGFTRDQLYHWCDADEDIRKAFNHFKICVAENRRHGAMIGKLNYAAVKNGLEKLDPEEKESFEYHNNLKGDALSKAGATTYVFQSANLPDPIVLPKPEDPNDISD